MKSEEIQAYKKAGNIMRDIIEYAKAMIKPGMKLIEIAEAIEDKTRELGGKPAFPVNLSINEIAAHYTPSSDDETVAEDLLNVDIGISVDGYIADAAFSLDLSEDGRFKEMINLNKEILDAVLCILKPGMKVKEIGEAIQDKLKKLNQESGKGYIIIKNLSGHSLDKNMIHAGLNISNYENENNQELNDIAIAIEPFLTTGAGEIYEGKDSEIFMLLKETNARDKDARELLKFVKENYATQPFCKRWLLSQGFKKLDFILKLLVKQEILHNFPILVEKSKKPVSQAEHTILITDKAEITTR